MVRGGRIRFHLIDTEDSRRILSRRATLRAIATWLSARQEDDGNRDALQSLRGRGRALHHDRTEARGLVPLLLARGIRRLRVRENATCYLNFADTLRLDCQYECPVTLSRRNLAF